MLRYSLRTLGAAVTAIAIACAALLNANHWVASTAWTLVFLVLSLGTITAVLTRRGFWTGFAIAGWLYLLVGIGPLSGYHNGNLLTTTALHQVAEKVQQNQQSSQQVATPTANFTYAIDYAFPVSTASPQGTKLLLLNSTSANTSAPSHSFVSIGQSLWTLLLALLGGWFGAFIVTRRPAQTESSD